MDVQEMIENKLVHEIHTSGRKSFRACRRRWDWIFNQSYYPIMTAKPLEFGTAFHAAMETYYEPSTWGMDREVIGLLSIKTFVDKCEDQRAKALASKEQSSLDEDVQQDYDERVELGKGMLRYYFKEVSPKIDVGWKPVRVEIAFMIPIPNPETGEPVIWCKCAVCLDAWWTHNTTKIAYNEWQANIDPTRWQPLSARIAYFTSVYFTGLPVVYAGRLDMLAEDEYGNYWIFDWKTCRSISLDDEFLYLDDQVGSYVWALRRLGLPIRGFVYHEQRKGFPGPPKQNSARRLGCLFSVAKNQDTDYETYLRHIKEFDPVAHGEGSYDKFLDFLKEEGITYYARHQIHKSEEEIASMETNIGLEALDMIDPNLRLYPSAGRFGCGFCAFRQPCMEKNAGGDYEYALNTMFEQREHYYVRNEPSTEGKGGE